MRQKLALSLSVASVVLAAVGINYFASRLNQETESRAIASSTELPAEISQQDKKWAHLLANESSAVVVSEKPSLQDELLYGFLEGKYGMRVSPQSGKIESLDFIPASTEAPLKISQKENFLMNYKDVLQYSFDEVQLQSKNGQEEVYVLLSAANTVVGRAFFSLNESGQVLSLKIIK